MKKVIAIIILGLLWCNVGIAEKISYKCFFPSGSPFPDQFNVDTVKKKVDKFDFEKGSTDNIIKVASFFRTEKKGYWDGMYFTIDLENDTILVQKVMEISPIEMMKARNDPFKAIRDDTMEVLLNCERSGEKSSQAEAVLTDRNLIKPNYYCKARQFGMGYFKLLNIEILPNDNFSLEYIFKVSEEESAPTFYHATFDRGQLMWFDLVKSTESNSGKPNLLLYQLFQEKNQKREFRMIWYVISQKEYDNLKPLYDQIMFFDQSDESIKNEEKFYKAAKKVFNKIKVEFTSAESGVQYDCDTNPENILVTEETTSQEPSQENEAEKQLQENVNAFEKKYISEKDYYDAASIMTTLGWNYFKGIDGFDQNNERSIFWNKKASKLGYSTASSNLGLFYYSGLVGFSQDLAKAHKYYVLAAEQWETSNWQPEDIVKEMDEHNPNPTKEFANLRDLFLAATKLRSEKRMNRLRDLVDLSQAEDEKMTVQDFLKRGAIYCENNYEISIHRFLSDNTLILKDFDTSLFTEEERIKALKFAKYNNEKVEWFEAVDAIVGIIEAALWRYRIYFDQKEHKQLVYESEAHFISVKEYMKLRGPSSIANNEKLSGMGGPKHVKFENLFFDEASNMFKKKSVSQEATKETSVCE
jgi:hypothetical protein